MGTLAPELLGPVGLELARAEEQLPGAKGMPGGSRFELKWDEVARWPVNSELGDGGWVGFRASQCE